jgi:uncharacterized membrane protein YbhN (UPF0104 family)
VRGRLALLARIAVSGAILAVIVPRIHLGTIAWTPASTAWLAAAGVLILAGIGISALRWQRVAAALGVPGRLTTMFGWYLAGYFVGSFLPSTVGGDVLRVARLSSSSGDTPASFASVVLERMTGWLVLPLLTLAGFLVNPGLLHLAGPGDRLALLLALGTLGALVVVVVLAGHPRLGGRLAGREGWTRFLGAVHLGLDRLRRSPGRAAEVVAVSVAYQVSVVIAVFLAAKALGLTVSFTAFLTFFPMVAVAQLLPVTVGGIGVREGALVIFLAHSHLGATTTQAATLGLVFYGMNLLVSLLGAPAFVRAPGVRAVTA